MHGRVTHRRLLRVVSLVLPAVLLLCATGPAAPDRCLQYTDAYVVCAALAGLLRRSPGMKDALRQLSAITPLREIPPHRRGGSYARLASGGRTRTWGESWISHP